MDLFQNHRIHVVSDANECRRLLQVLEPYVIEVVKIWTSIFVLYTIVSKLFSIIFCFFQALWTVSSLRSVHLLMGFCRFKMVSDQVDSIHSNCDWKSNCISFLNSKVSTASGRCAEKCGNQYLYYSWFQMVAFAYSFDCVICKPSPKSSL